MGMTHGNQNGFLFVYFYHRTWIAPEICWHNANVESSSKSLMPYYDLLRRKSETVRHAEHVRSEEVT